MASLMKPSQEKRLKIIVDSREQKPLWKGKLVEVKALKEGDYTIEGLEDALVIERKTPGDLYGSIVQGHDRFRREIDRSREKGKDFFVFVEKPYVDFITKNWKGGFYRKLKPRTIAKIVCSLKRRHNVKFVWCKNRNDMKKKIKSLFNLYYLHEFNKLCFD